MNIRDLLNNGLPQVMAGTTMLFLGEFFQVIGIFLTLIGTGMGIYNQWQKNLQRKEKHRLEMLILHKKLNDAEPQQTEQVD